jgi:hypothetical protein
VLLSNAGGDANPWLNLRLHAGIVGEQTDSFKANYYGVGSLIEVRSGTRVQRQSVSGQITHFGLARQQPDTVRVIWTTGVPQNIIHPQVNAVICDEQILLSLP